MTSRRPRSGPSTEYPAHPGRSPVGRNHRLAAGDAPIDSGTGTDGRRVRREKNRLAVLDAVIEMFAEESLIPSIEDASRRSGLSLRSVYRYFADPDELIEAAIGRHLELTIGYAHLPHIGEGRVETRIDDFVAMRLRLYEHVGSTFRVTLHNAPRNVRLREEIETTRRRLRQQFELQFAPELDGLPATERIAVVAAGDVLTQFDSLEILRRHRRLSVAETHEVVRFGLARIL